MLNSILTAILFFILGFWPISLFMSAMMFGGPGSRDNQTSIVFMVLFLMYPIYIFSLLALFNKPFFGIKPLINLSLSFAIVLGSLYSFGYLTMLKNSIMGISNEGWFFKGASVYYMGHKLKGVDRESFKIIEDFGSGWYARDKRVVYFRDKKISGADPETFDMIEHQEWGKFGHFVTRDKNQVYYFGEAIEGADPHTFEVLDNLRGKDKLYEYREGRRIR